MFKIVSRMSKFLVFLGFVFLAMFFLNFSLNFRDIGSAGVVADLEISSAEELIDFSSRIGAGDNFYSKQVHLTQDIDLSGIDWQTIGVSRIKAFAGTFNGNMHKISGLTLNTSGNTGLFGALCGEIQNLVVETEIILQDFGEKAKIGGIAGYLIGKQIEGNMQYGSISNCAVYAKIQVNSANSQETYVGGLVGSCVTNTKITDCIAYVQNEYDFRQNDKMNFGLLVGSECAETNCVSYGNNNFADIQNENINPGKLDLGTNWSFCESCAQMYLVGDSTHLHPNETKTVIPELATSIYEYTQKPLVLDLKPITKLNENDDVSYSIDILSQNLGENIAKISLIGADADKYILSTDTLKFNVSAKKVYVDITENSSIYGEQINEIKYTQTIDEDLQLKFGLFKDNKQIDTFLAGEYNIKVTASNPNYTLIVTEAKYTILPKSVVPKTNEYTIYYTDVFDFSSIVLENILDKDKNGVYCIYTDTIPQNIGTYPLKIELAGEMKDSYYLTQDEIKLTILPKDITVSWEEKEFVFNNTPQYPLAQIPLSITTEKIDLKYTQYGTTAGSYTVCVESENINYAITNNKKDYTISVAQVLVTWKENTHIFDNQPFFPTYEINLDFEYDFVITTSPSQINAGTYTATLNTSNKNILLKNNIIDFSITQHKIEIIWTETEFVFDNSPHTPQYTFAIPFEYDLEFVSLTAQTNASTYNCELLTLNPNFLISNAKTKFVIKKYDFKLEWSNNLITFNNTTQFPIVQNTLPFKYNLDISYSSGQINAGKYTATATTKDPNINLLNFEIEYEISPYICDIVWSNTSTTFNNKSFNPSYTYTIPFKYDFEIELTSPQTHADQYIATATTKDPNIILTNASTSFTISPRTVYLDWTNTKVCYTGYPQTPKYTFDSFGYDFALKLIGKQEGVGKYTVTATTSDKNIHLTNAETLFEIYKLSCEVVWSENEFEYNGKELCPTPTLILAENINKEKIILKKKGASSVVGKHTAIAYTDNENISLYNTTCAYTITENSTSFVSQEQDLDVLVSGEFVGEVDISITTLDNQQAIPRTWDILYAIKLEHNIEKLAQNQAKLSLASLSESLISFSENNINEYKFNITYTQISNEINLKLYLIADNEYYEIEYEQNNKKLSFSTQDLGILCIVDEKPDTYYSDIIRSIIGISVLFLISIIIILKRYREKRIIVFKKTTTQTSQDQPQPKKHPSQPKTYNFHLQHKKILIKKQKEEKDNSNEKFF